MIRLEAKQDPRGALASWQKLLKLNPQLDPERKAQVQKLMSDASGGLEWAERRERSGSQ